MAEGLRRGTHAAALVELPGCGPSCLSKLLTAQSASEVWALIVVRRSGGGRIARRVADDGVSMRRPSILTVWHQTWNETAS